MEDFFAMMLEFLGELLENALRGIKNPRKRKWAITVFYTLIALLVCAPFVFLALTCYREGKMIGALCISTLTGGLVFGALFLIIREHRKS